MNRKYVLMGRDRDSKAFWYTGKAGEAWVSENYSEAFRYSDSGAARLKAKTFNSREALTGLWFLPLDTQTAIPIYG